MAGREVLGGKGNLKSQAFMNQVYHTLDDHFQLEYGKNLLLATSSRTQIEKMTALNLPFFENYAEDIRRCLSGQDCKTAYNILESAGKIILLRSLKH